MPYAMLSSSIDPEKMGIMMGIFNMFIVIPQILAALGGIIWASEILFDGDTAFTMMIAGLSLIGGALSLMLVDPSVH